MHLIVVAACSAQAAHMPRIDDLAVLGWEEGNQRLRRAVGVALGLAIFNDGTGPEHPFAMSDTAAVAPPSTDPVAVWLCRCSAGRHQRARNDCLVIKEDLLGSSG